MDFFVIKLSFALGVFEIVPEVVADVLVEYGGGVFSFEVTDEIAGVFCWVVF